MTNKLTPSQERYIKIRKPKAGETAGYVGHYWTTGTNELMVITRRDDKYYLRVVGKKGGGELEKVLSQYVFSEDYAGTLEYLEDDPR